MHVESISEFKNFLLESKVPENIIHDYLYYHFADGTIDGTGEKRIGVDNYKKYHQENIDFVNKVFNEKKLLNKAITRFVLKGNNSIYLADAIICGEVNDFLWITKDDVRKIILSKKDLYSTAVHFGPLTYQPKSRCLNFNLKYDSDCFYIQIKWYNIYDNIIENMNNKISSLK